VAAQAKKKAFGGAFDLQIIAEGKPENHDTKTDHKRPYKNS